MDKVIGTNLGNWLVLEKWIFPPLFDGVDAEDEVWLNRRMDKNALAARMKEHRDTYVSEEDFQYIKEQGMNLVRIPVPYFIFGDRPPYLGCIEYLDKAFDWAEKHDLQIMIDLHTVPGSQNGYDNGGITGVCKWCQNPDEVKFALSVLERLAQRYADREGLYGIEVLNEPISWLVYVTAPSTGKAVDKEEAKGSGYVPMDFLKQFYKDAYVVLRKHLNEDKVIVFHDGFRLGAWKDFFVRSGMKNVVLDTHIYVFAMESFVPIHKPWVYKIFIDYQKWLIAQAQKYTPVIVGEWCICNRYAEKATRTVQLLEEAEAERTNRYRQCAAMQLEAWDTAAGHIYWSYQFNRDHSAPMDESWKESWNLSKCLTNGWLSFRK